MYVYIWTLAVGPIPIPFPKMPRDRDFAGPGASWGQRRPLTRRRHCRRRTNPGAGWSCPPTSWASKKTGLGLEVPMVTLWFCILVIHIYIYIYICVCVWKNGQMGILGHILSQSCATIIKISQIINFPYDNHPSFPTWTITHWFYRCNARLGTIWTHYDTYCSNQSVSFGIGPRYHIMFVC